jgi:hypothetical protein
MAVWERRHGRKPSPTRNVLAVAVGGGIFILFAYFLFSNSPVAQFWSSSPVMFKDIVSAGLLSLSMVTPSSATLLYVSSYAGTVTTLNLILPSGNASSPAALQTVSISTGCASSPSWLTLDDAKSVLYCLNEGLTGLSSVSSFKTSSNGSLVQLDQLDVISGPVAAVIYGGDRDGLALAQ